MRNAPLAIVYWFAIIQYITRSLPSTVHLYQDTQPLKCEYNFVAQFTFWLGLLWAIYFTLPAASNTYIFLLCALQITITLGRLYEIHKSEQIFVNYDMFLIHWVGFFIALYMLNTRVRFLNIHQLLSTFIVGLLYLLVFYIYQRVNIKQDCQPERLFNILTKGGAADSIRLICVNIVVSLAINYLYLAR